MGLIALEDREIYFPGLALDDCTLENAIAQAQLLLESPKGCDRSLEVTTYSDRVTVDGTRRVFFRHLPVLQTPTPTIEIKRPSAMEFGRSNPMNEWETLTADQYEIDYEEGQVDLFCNTQSFAGVAAFSRYSGISQSNVPLSYRNSDRIHGKTEVRITYQSGFNFNDNTNPVVKKLKSLVAAAVQASTANPAYNQGYASFTLEGFYSIDYVASASKSSESNTGASSSGNQSLDNLLSLLQKYRPRFSPV